MGNIDGKFADQDSYILTQQIQTANNNTTTLQAVLAETDQVRGSSVAISSQAVTRTLATPYPTASVAVGNTLGAAIAGIGQGGTYSEEPGGGGIPCFLPITNIATPDGYKFIRNIRLEDKVMAFDPVTGALSAEIVTDLYQHLVEAFLLVMFEDGHSTGVDEKGEHRYWTRNGEYAPIIDLNEVWHYDDCWSPRKIIEKKVIREQTVLYNFTVAGMHNYIANGDGVSNVKPGDDPLLIQ